MAVGNRITGKLGRLFIGNVTIDPQDLIPDTVSWQIEYRLQADECGIKGEVAEQYSYGVFTGTLRAERFQNSDGDSAGENLGDILLARMLVAASARTGATAIPAATDSAGATGANGGGLPVQFVLQTLPTADLGTEISGSGLLVSGSINTPRGGMATDSVEIQLNAIPAIIDVTAVA